MDFNICLINKFLNFDYLPAEEFYLFYIIRDVFRMLYLDFLQSVAVSKQVFCCFHYFILLINVLLVVWSKSLGL